MPGPPADAARDGRVEGLHAYQLRKGDVTKATLRVVVASSNYHVALLVFCWRRSDRCRRRPRGAGTPPPNTPPTAPPASKEAVENLPIIMVTEEIIIRLGDAIQCAICWEKMVMECNVLEMPCKHLFHAPCLKSWLVMISPEILLYIDR